MHTTQPCSPDSNATVNATATQQRLNANATRTRLSQYQAILPAVLMR